MSRLGGRWGAAAVAAGLLVWSNAVLPASGWGVRARTAANGLLAVALLGAARLAGWGRAELGLVRAAPGLRWGVAAAALPVVGIAAATWAAARRGAADPAALAPAAPAPAASHPPLAEWVLVVIPVGTVLLEEVAFRAVLDAVAGPVAQAAVFGAWHVGPARVAGDPVVPTVIFTTAAGLVFGWLRRRSGSLLAPAVLHFAVNAAGAVASTRGLAKPL